jgi:hypothetical protein
MSCPLLLKGQLIEAIDVPTLERRRIAIGRPHGGSRGGALNLVPRAARML